MSKRTGWFVLGYGAVLVVHGVAILLTAETDCWATVGLLMGLTGGGVMGLGLSDLLFPDPGHHPVSDLEDARSSVWDPPCFEHGSDPCLTRTPYCPPDRTENRA